MSTLVESFILSISEMAIQKIFIWCPTTCQAFASYMQHVTPLRRDMQTSKPAIMIYRNKCLDGGSSRCGSNAVG